MQGRYGIDHFSRFLLVGALVCILLSGLLRAEYTKRGIKFLLHTKVTGVSQTPEGITVTYEQDGTEGTVCGENC